MYAGPGLPCLAKRYVDTWAVDSGMGGTDIAHLARLWVDLDVGFCARVGDYYDGAARLRYDAALRRGYDRYKEENMRQYQAVLDAGIEVRPWRGTGQPYRDSRELAERVRGSGTLSVFLTRDGHGGPGCHPMRESAGIRVDGVDLTHNDIFRAVHDIFGHVMFGHSFGPKGELKAAYTHMHMYSAESHPILFTEHVGQICWFFFGPHVRGDDGRVLRRHEPGFIDPARRPYPAQKVFAFDRTHIDEFQNMFSYRSPDDPHHA